VNSYGNGENQYKGDHLEEGETPNNTVIYGGQDERNNE
jgi:hypothetical protein